MNSYCGIQQTNDGDTMSGSDTVVVCPKPRRVGVLSNQPSRPMRRHHCEVSDSRAGSELLDIILSNGVHGAERSSIQVALSPPFFCGSPPSRVSNPLIQDARFREEKQLNPPCSPLPSSPIQVAPSRSASSPNSSSRKGGCVRLNFGNNPAVRVEGFDCLDRDRRNCSIPALA